VRKGDFHIYTVSAVDEAVELLTGVAAGERDAEGKYPEGTINQRVDARLREMGETMRRFGRPQQAPAPSTDGKPEAEEPGKPPRDPTAPPPDEPPSESDPKGSRDRA
jgi:hypothetical protein